MMAYARPSSAWASRILRYRRRRYLAGHAIDERVTASRLSRVCCAAGRRAEQAEPRSCERAPVRLSQRGQIDEPVDRLARLVVDGVDGDVLVAGLPGGRVDLADAGCGRDLVAAEEDDAVVGERRRPGVSGRDGDLELLAGDRRPGSAGQVVVVHGLQLPVAAERADTRRRHGSALRPALRAGGSGHSG